MQFKFNVVEVMTKSEFGVEPEIFKCNVSILKSIRKIKLKTAGVLSKSNSFFHSSTITETHKHKSLQQVALLLESNLFKATLRTG